MAKKYNILLLTNRDSDNIGDQVIEACDIALIKAVMNNLEISSTDYTISSRAGSIVSKKYIETKDAELLKGAEKAIKQADVVIFGGAPVFNYLYQVFYERTASTLEIAEKYNKPVIFSAVGIERYEEENRKCQRLKETLNFDCVKQITTRDGIEELRKYKEKEDLVIDRVSDPAVFSAQVFRNFDVNAKFTAAIEQKKSGILKKCHLLRDALKFDSGKEAAVQAVQNVNVVANTMKDRKTVGIFIFRANGFRDNKIDFTKEDAAKLWLEVIQELETRGYDYDLLTSGHFGDEAFLDYLIRKYGVKESRCVFNMNTPEKLIEKISSYDAVISCRLHPSIISFSLNVPSVGLIWNSKVTHFYECMGYEDRAIAVEGLEAKGLVDKVEEIMAQGVAKDEEYLMTVYRYLFYGIQNALGLQGRESSPYSYAMLTENIPAYTKTSAKEQGDKLKRKFRRIYETLNMRMDKVEKLREIESFYRIFYHSGKTGEGIALLPGWDSKINGEVRKLDAKTLEIKSRQDVKNDGSGLIPDNMYENENKEFIGWNLRFRMGSTWYWYLKKDAYCLKENGVKDKSKRLFRPGETIPCLPFFGVESVVLVAQWKRKKEVVSTKEDSNSKKFQILLLTNRDSDNLGDQVIEACDISLIQTVMENLNLTEGDYKIISRAASIVSKKYVETKDESLLENLKKRIQSVDLIVFGGAPLFNYKYQIFYERTAVTLEIAQQYDKPVIFSGIGIESYDEQDPKCQRLKKTLNFDCVKQITTRDGFEELKKYRENDKIVIDRVSDPAVFTNQVFQNFVGTRKNPAPGKIGLFVFRAEGFQENDVDFTKKDEAKLWLGIIGELERKGYDYTVLTNGHFGDEVFLDYMVRECGVKREKCVFNMNSPEKLIKEISACDGVISVRLYPSIISFSLGVPSVGLIWNPKVSHFYDCIGYPDRKVEFVGIEPQTVVEKMEEAMNQGITKDEEYLVTVYQSLFHGIQNALQLTEEKVEPYDYDTLVQKIPPYEGTSQSEQEEKLKRKFRRIYGTLNKDS